MNKSVIRSLLMSVVFISFGLQAAKCVSCKKLLCEINKLKDRLPAAESCVDSLKNCATPITGPTTISSSGTYCLEADFSVSSGDGITISASDVSLDLAGKTITGSGGDTGVMITSGRDGVTIKNGKITGMGEAGIFVDTSTNCVIADCDILSSPTGITISGGDHNRIKDCVITDVSSAGVSLISSNTNCIRDCKVLEASGSNNLYGFRSEGGVDNFFDSCFVQDMLSLSSTPSTVAAGFSCDVDEQGCKILSCQVCSVQTAATNVRPFGIRLEYDDTDLLMTLTNFEHGVFIESVSWSPDGRYVAIGGEGTGDFEVRVLAFDGSSLSSVADFDHGIRIHSVDWSPDGRFVAIGGFGGTGGFEVRVFAFDGSSLTDVADFDHGNTIFSVSWSPDGRFVAIGGFGGTGSFRVRVLVFDGSSLTDVADFDHGDPILSVSWSPDGRFVAIGGGGLEVRVLAFDGSSLTSVADFDHGADDIESVSWSPDGRFVAIGGSGGDGGFEVRVLEFDGSSLTSVADFDHGDRIESVSFSPDGRYLAIGGQGGTGGFEVRVLEFDGSSLTDVADFDHGTSVRSVSWSPGGQQIAIGGSGGTGGFEVRVLTALTVPQDCVIQNCLVKKINGIDVVFSDGVGISASSDANVIAHNVVVESDQPYNFLVSQFIENSLFNFAPFGNRIFP